MPHFRSKVIRARPCRTGGWPMVVLTASAAVAEMVGWVISDSQALLAGAAHLLLDLVPRALVLLSQRGRAARVALTILLGMFACLLLLVMFQVLMRGAHRMLHPAPVLAVWLVCLAPLGLAAAVARWRVRRRSMPSARRDSQLSMVAALGVGVAAAAVAGAGSARIDTVMAMLIAILLLPRLVFVIEEYEQRPH